MLKGRGHFHSVARRGVVQTNWGHVGGVSFLLRFQRAGSSTRHSWHVVHRRALVDAVGEGRQRQGGRELLRWSVRFPVRSLLLSRSGRRGPRSCSALTTTTVACVFQLHFPSMPSSFSLFFFLFSSSSSSSSDDS